MKHIFHCGIFLLAIIVHAAGAQAQPGLYAASGTNIFIRAGTVFSTDSLVLTPSADFNIAGLNGVVTAASLLHTSSNPAINRVFRFTSTTAPFSGSIAIYYSDAELNGIAEGSLTLNIHNGVKWNSFNSNITRDALNNVVNTNNLTNQPLNEITLAALLAPLPVKFLSVSALCKPDGVLVRWQTATENNSKNFEVQQSPDGVSWRPKGTIAAAGNSSVPLSYEYFDNTPGGSDWYRITEYDADGRTTISPLVKSSCLLFPALRVFPNPVLETAYFNINSSLISSVTLKLYDARGALLKSDRHPLSAGTNLLPVDMQGFARGWYTMTIIWNGNTSQISILKQ